MTPEQSYYELQWQPMMLGTTKAERLETEHLEKMRVKRALRQKQREETVLFMQSFLYMALCFAGLVGLTILL